MLLSSKKLLSAGLLSIVTLSAYAQTAPEYIIVAPQCLLKTLGTEVTVLSTDNDLALIKTHAAGINKLITAKTHQAKPCGGFMDVTADWNKQDAKKFLSAYTASPKQSALAAKTSTYAVQYETQVNTLLNSINPQDMWTNLTTLSSMDDRYAYSENGKSAAKWIKDKIETIAAQNNRTDVKVYYVETGKYVQPSVVVRVGNDDNTNPAVIIGSHEDSLLENDRNGISPGADDDGSGSVTNLEVARTILSSGLQFKNPIYFIWYAAEEEGLIGSQYVVKDFKNKKIPVKSVLQFDMTGYANQKNPNTIWLINDNINKDLTSFIAALTQTYVKQPVGYTRCGYACSDHASWNKGGFAAAFPFEAAFGQDDPDIHTTQDTMDKLSLAHMTDFAKLGVAYVVEMAEPVAR